MKLWMRPAGAPEPPYIVAFRCRFSVAHASSIPFRFSADECCQLFLDGKWLLSGPERGIPQRWYYQQGSMDVAPGEHVLVARVLCFGKEWTAYGQMSIQHGFYFEDPDGILQTWEYQLLEGCEFRKPFPDWGTFPRISVGTSYNKEMLEGRSGNWQPVEFFNDERKLFAPDLPLMRREAIQPVAKSGSIHTFSTYACAWASYKFTGSGQVKIRWFEAPYCTEEFDDVWLKGEKGRRDGAFIVGNHDEFEVDGELVWHDFWWHAGCHVEIIADEGVSVDARFYQTGYPFPPLKLDSELHRMALHTLQCCSMETFLDCPWYEQLMYIGDSRITARIVYHLFQDHRLPEKALRIFSLSQQEDGSLRSHYPSKGMQKIPSFTLIYLLMLQDYFKVHGKNSLILEILPRAEKIGAYILRHRGADGLLRFPDWNFIDWTAEWDNGVPPAGAENCPLQWFGVLALRALAKITEAEEWLQAAKQLQARIHEHYYVPERGLYADDLQHQSFSEHAQVLALLADPAAPVKEALACETLIECSIYFSFYYLEACRCAGLTELAAKRLQKWESLPEQGLKTLPEEFVQPRSDCHAWGAHILLELPSPNQQP
ncbi:MAG: hypothetical protein GX946_11895 [Oligosphaeraceae bacterium]|nr:hypothetical protein [Oligosphaeraceae bacterium]